MEQLLLKINTIFTLILFNLLINPFFVEKIPSQIFMVILILIISGILFTTTLYIKKKVVEYNY